MPFIMPRQGSDGYGTGFRLWIGMPGVSGYGAYEYQNDKDKSDS